MIRKVFLDLDGVCNKFSSYALRYVGAVNGMLEYKDYPKECCTWDIVHTANFLKSPTLPEYTSTKFWNSLDMSFWATIPVEPYLDSLLGYLVDRVGRDNICIASSATLSPESLAGKLYWVHKNMPKWMHRQYMFGRDKFLLASPDALLIDDRQENSKKFYACGGKSILVPRPWNVLRGLSTVHTLSSSFKKQFGVPWV